MARSRPSLLLRAQTDARLLVLFRAGHEAAFEEVVRRYRARLVHHAARIAGHGDADDVVQESLAIAYHALRHTEVAALRAWLYTVVRNRALTDLGERRRLLEPLSDDVAGVDDPSHAADQRATLASLVAQLRAMPDGQREALVKHEFEGLDYRRVAHDLEMTPGAAKQLVYRARCRLRRAAGALMPSGILHALGAQGPEVAAGTAGGGAVALLLKGGIATGVLAGAVAVGAGPAHDAPRQAQAQAPVARHHARSQAAVAAAAAPYITAPRSASTAAPTTTAAAVAAVPIASIAPAAGRRTVAMSSPAPAQTPAVRRAPSPRAGQDRGPSPAPVQDADRPPGASPRQPAVDHAAAAKASAARPPSAGSQPPQRDQGTPQ